MKSESSRRAFLASGLALPVAGAASAPSFAPSMSPPPAFAEEPAVSYRVLGKTGLKVSTVGFGCMVTSDPSVITRAADLGINHFDTSRDYSRGNNESMVGAALGNRRRDVVLSSKTDGLTAQAALAELDTSLQALKTDHLDIWYLHEKSSAADISDELLEAQQSAKKAGKIRFTGVSAHAGHSDVIARAIQSGRCDVLLLSYNFAMEDNLGDAIRSAQAAGIGVVAMKVMAGSFVLPGLRIGARERIGQPGVALAALKWALSNPNVSSAIPSIRDTEQLAENMKAMSTPFTPADAQLLAAQLDFIRPLYCRACGACDGLCPRGVPVPDVLRCLMYAEGYGEFPLARERFQKLPAAAAAADCRNCPGCVIRCPNGVDVARRLARAQELFA